MAKTEPRPSSRRRARPCSSCTRRPASSGMRPRIGAHEQAAAIDLLGRIEVEIARLERAMDPPKV